ncbi:MAG: hypothetical protein KAT68_05775 [Bacteroidales bacterium]|nr:hypothetical protein [Bacteroidales bacterium]
MEKEKLKLWLEFGKFFLGTFLIGFISLVINSGFESREIAIKESEQIGKYVEIALREDVGVRKRFAEYFKTVSVSDEYRERWTEYFHLVNSEFKMIETKALNVQMKMDSLNMKINLITKQNENEYQNKVDSLKEIIQTELIELQNEKENLQKELSVKKQDVSINEPFIIGLYSLKPNEKEKKLIKKYITENNFYFDSEYDYSYKQSWMAGESTVFYYSKSSKIHAEQIASDLKELVGKSFKVSYGAGLGVLKDKKSITFYIHNIN